MDSHVEKQASSPRSHRYTGNFSLPRPSTFWDSKDDNPLGNTESRQSIAERLPDTARNHCIAVCGEFIGTLLFLFFALSGTQVANSINSSDGKSLKETGNNPQQLLYIAVCFGFSLAVNAWTFFRISGGLFNPAVTLGLCLIGALPWVRGALLFVTQIVAGMAAAALVSCMFPGPLDVSTTLGAGTSTVQGVFIEMFLTAQLVFTIFMLAAEKHRGTFIAPIGIGLSLFIAELTGVHWTGGSLNPARSFGPCVATRSFPGTHWIYWVGPLLGATVASGLFYLFKFLHYETANPGQDGEAPRGPYTEAERLGSSIHKYPDFSSGSVTSQAGGVMSDSSRRYLYMPNPEPADVEIAMARDTWQRQPGIEVTDASPSLTRPGAMNGGHVAWRGYIPQSGHAIGSNAAPGQNQGNERGRFARTLSSGV